MTVGVRLASVFVAAVVLGATASAFAESPVPIIGITPFRLGATREESVYPGMGHCLEPRGESMTECVVPYSGLDGKGHIEMANLWAGPPTLYVTNYVWFKANRLVTIKVVFENRGPGQGGRTIAYNVAQLFAAMKAHIDQFYGPAVSDSGATVVYRDVMGNTYTLIGTDHITVIVQAGTI